MKITKSFFLSILLVGLFSFTSSATDPVTDKSNNKVTTQISNHLKGIDLSNITETETIKVDFMINAKAEIIVVSTSKKGMDTTIKNKLNYKKLNSPNLEIFKTYTVPVTFKK